MHEKSAEALAKRIAQFFELVRAEGNAGFQESGHRAYSSKGRGIVMTPAIQVEFEKMVDELAKVRDFRESYQREALASRLINAILASKVDDALDEVVQSVAMELAEHIKWFNIYVPLSGFVLEKGSAFRFADIELRTFDKDEEFDETFRKSFRSLQPEHLSAAQIERDEKSYMEYIAAVRTRPVVIIRARTGSGNARHVAFDRVQPIADYWQFCAGMIHRDPWLPLVDYHMNAMQRSLMAFPVIAEDGTEIDFPIVPGSAPELRLNQKYMGHLQKHGLLDIQNVFGEPKGDEGDGFDALLRRAIQNYADGDRAASPRQKLLSYASSSELFFTRTKDVTVAVCHGIAKTLSEAGCGEYGELKALAERMYTLRSRTIHNGVTPRNADVEQYSGIAQRVILEMVKHRDRFATITDIEEWSSPPAVRERLYEDLSSTAE